MNMGALASTPSRRSWMTWPISWTSSSSTNPTANLQPQMRLYAAIDTSIVPDVVRILSLPAKSSANLAYFRIRPRPTTNGASSRRSPRCGSGAGSGRLGSGACAPGGSHVTRSDIRPG